MTALHLGIHICHIAASMFKFLLLKPRNLLPSGILVVQVNIQHLTSKYSTLKFSNLSAQDVRPASLPVVLCLSLIPYADGRNRHLL